MTFNLEDQRHLTAAEGWLELGLHLEANVELDLKPLWDSLGGTMWKRE
jgi:hypothetical protein